MKVKDWSRTALGYPDSWPAELRNKSGFDHYMVKPVNPLAVVDLLAQIGTS